MPLKIRLLVLLTLCLLLTACQTHFASSRRPALPAVDKDVINLTERLTDGRHVQKVDNLIFMLDDSNSLLHREKGVLRRDLALALLDRLELTIPRNINLAQGLRIFGPNANGYDFKNTLVYGMAQGDKNGLRKLIINNTPADSIFNPLAQALDAEYLEMKRVKGRTAIIIISDFSSPYRQPLLDTADMIDAHYHGRIKVYPVLIGSSPAAFKLASRLPERVGGGFTIRAARLNDSAAISDFMESILFDISSPPPVISADGKTMPPKPQVIKQPPPLSYKKLQHDKVLRVHLKTLFDFDKAVIKPQYQRRLEEVVHFMKKYPDTTTVLAGYTCSIGTEDYNLRLSERRALAVKDYLVRRGVEAGRLAIKAYGESHPIADNSTLAGRIKNRRVVAVITTRVSGK
jgi:OOP family OmpA-OmpF porin